MDAPPLVVAMSVAIDSTASRAIRLMESRLICWWRQGVLSIGGGIRTELKRLGVRLQGRPAVWRSAIASGCLVTLLGVASPAAAVASAWSAQPEPLSWAPGGISCTAPSACVVVGRRSDSTRRGLPAAAWWNGRRWAQQKTPTPPGGGSLGAVSCSSQSFCMAIGCCSGGPPLAERWNGHEWSMLRVRPGAKFSALSCSSPSACTAVGWVDVDQPLPDEAVLVGRWDGRSWTTQRAPSPGWAHDSLLNSVACVSLTFCVGVGMNVGGQFDETTKALVERWDGRRWTINRVPAPAGSFSTELSGVACTSSAACTAVGDVDGAALVERWNGRAWFIQPTPNEAQAPLTGVSCVSATVCEAVGTANADAQGSTAPPPEMVAERWNGRRWSSQHVPHAPGPSWLDIVACPSARSCYAWGLVNGTAAFERYS